MVYLFAVPFGFALANYLVPLQIGAPDLAFPRLNALSYWLYLFGGVDDAARVRHRRRGGRRSAGSPIRRCRARPARRASAPTCGSSRSSSPARRARSSAVNIITTVTMMRAPGMTMFRMPILTWNLFLTSFMVLVAFPVLTGALMMLEADRRFGTHFFDPHERRFADAVAAPVLVLRPPRGVHRGPAVLRRGHRDLPGVLRASRCSGTRASSSPRWRSRRCRRRCGRTTCSSPDRWCCRSSPPRRSSSPCRPASRCSTGSARCGAAR